MSILEKIAKAKADLKVDKTGFDEQNQYYYWKADDVAAAVRGVMVKHNIIHRTLIDSLDIDNHWDKQGRNRPRVTAVVSVIFTDPDDGSSFTTQAVATGSDIGGDKASRKLMVQAFKEVAIDVFTIAEGMDGMDSDTYAEAPADVAAEDPAEAPEAVAKRTAKELGARVQEIINDTEDFAHITGDVAMTVGARISKEVLGKEVRPATWRKDPDVLAALVKAFENGEVE